MPLLASKVCLYEQKLDYFPHMYVALCYMGERLGRLEGKRD